MTTRREDGVRGAASTVCVDQSAACEIDESARGSAASCMSPCGAVKFLYTIGRRRQEKVSLAGVSVSVNRFDRESVSERRGEPQGDATPKPRRGLRRASSDRTRMQGVWLDASICSYQSSKTLLGSPSSTFDRKPFPFPRLKDRSPILRALISRLLPPAELAEATRRESLLAL